MHRSQKLDGWRRLDEFSRKFLPLVVPWILVPSGFSVFAAFMHACANNSIQEIVVFVVVPVALWMGFSRACSARVYGPTFAPSSVGALIAFVAATHFLQTSSATSGLYNAIFGSACITTGGSFWRMITSDPGRVIPVPNSYVFLNGDQKQFDIENADSRYSDSFSIVMEVDERGQQGRKCNVCSIKQPLRSKHCKYCNACVERYDHHCPAIYNCVGGKNHVQFLGMLMAFILTESLYVNSCITYLQVHVLEKPQAIEATLQKGDFYNEVKWLWGKIGEVLKGDPWVLSTAAFAGTQILWQVPLLIFHIFCACSNLTTDEMFHWEKYHGLYVEAPPAPALGRPFVGKEFVNPYSKGLKQNLISFLKGHS